MRIDNTVEKKDVSVGDIKAIMKLFLGYYIEKLSLVRDDQMIQVHKREVREVKGMIQMQDSEKVNISVRLLIEGDDDGDEPYISLKNIPGSTKHSLKIIGEKVVESPYCQIEIRPAKFNGSRLVFWCKTDPELFFKFIDLLKIKFTI